MIRAGHQPAEHFITADGILEPATHQARAKTSLK